MSTKLGMLSNHLILCHSLLLLLSIFPSLGVFPNELAPWIRWPNYWSFSISPSKEYWGLISFRIDWFDLLAVLGTLKSLLQHHNSKHQFFSAQPSLQSNSHIWTWLWLDGTLLANWCLCFMIRCLGLPFFFKEQASFNFMGAVIVCSDFVAPENKVCHCFHVFPVYLPWSDGIESHNLSFWMLQCHWGDGHPMWP